MHSNSDFRNLFLFLSVIFCEALDIYGVIVQLFYITNVRECSSIHRFMYSPSRLRAGYAIFAAGIICGLCKPLLRIVRGYNLEAAVLCLMFPKTLNYFVVKDSCD
ncbi:hypothetical protein NC652_018183 [Populus alba x Populus x berolinensis]|nr:hypothetical protein NC652_018183 [Populus alba x Populus x berolinensis]